MCEADLRWLRSKESTHRLESSSPSKALHQCLNPGRLSPCTHLSLHGCRQLHWHAILMPCCLQAHLQAPVACWHTPKKYLYGFGAPSRTAGRLPANQVHRKFLKSRRALGSV